MGCGNRHCGEGRRQQLLPPRSTSSPLQLFRLQFALTLLIATVTEVATVRTHRPSYPRGRLWSVTESVHSADR